MKKGYLVLSNGKAFEGSRIGADVDGIGELVFTTNMEGYLETLTDPSYAGQIVMQTFPLIGNYGVIEEDFEGESAVKGYVVSELCDAPSNFRSEYALGAFLKQKGIPGLSGIDTREVTKIIREYGVVNAMIVDKIPENTQIIQQYNVKDVVRTVTTKEIKTYTAVGKPAYKVALIDFGAKKNIVRNLQSRGCEVTVFPCDVKADTLLNGDFNGVMLSNGPGDPTDNADAIAEIKKLVGKIPMFGICLGHQLTALAMGGRTEKLKYGHRGGNQPVKDSLGARTYISSQNHGYVVVADSLKGVAKEIFTNANDGTNEGLYYPGKKCFTVQFHPEAASGPHDTGFLFDAFLHLMEGKEYAEG